MKKLLILSTILLALSLSACGINKPSEAGPSQDDDSYDTEEESEEREWSYIGYPDDENGYNAPKNAQFDVIFDYKDDGVSNTREEYTNVIINNNEMYFWDPHHKTHNYLYGSYKVVNEEQKLQYWMYDFYHQFTKESDVEFYGAGWLYISGSAFQIAAGYFHAQYIYDYALLKDNVCTKTMATITFGGVLCNEYKDIHNPGYYYYYSQDLNIFVGYRQYESDDENADYLGYYITNYSTNVVEITNKPSEEELRK